jgi:hypothetical protein
VIDKLSLIVHGTKDHKPQNDVSNIISIKTSREKGVNFPDMAEKKVSGSDYFPDTKDSRFEDL